MMQIWYDTFERLDSDPLISDVYTRRLQDRVAPSGQSWNRAGGELSLPDYDRVGVYSDTGGLMSAPRFTYEGVLYTPASFPPDNGATGYDHPAGGSIYYLTEAAASRTVTAKVHYVKSGIWYGATDAGIEAIPSVIIQYNPNTNSYYQASFDPLTATLTITKVVGGSVVSSTTQLLRDASFATAGVTVLPAKDTWVELSLSCTPNSGDNSKDDVYAQVAIGYSGTPAYATGQFVTAFGGPVTALAAGYVGLKLETFSSYGGGSARWFSATCEPLELAGGAFMSVYYDPDAEGLRCVGYSILEGGFHPLQYVWYVNGDEVEAEEDGSVLLTEWTYDQVWNGSEYEDTATEFTFQQVVRDIRSTNNYNEATREFVEGAIIDVEDVVGETTVTVNPPGQTGPEGSITPYKQKSLGAKAKIIAAPLESNGIQTFSISTDGTTPGRSHLLQHTDGLLYIIYGESADPTNDERSIYMQASSDNGTTWGTAICLTSGFWDDAPCAISLDDDNIGIVFNRATELSGTGAASVLYRMVVDTDGVLIGGIDPLTDSPAQYGPPSMVRKDDGYLVAAYGATESVDTAIAVHFWENPTFESDDWEYRADLATELLAQIPGWSGAQPPLVQGVTIRGLSNGDIVLLVTVAADMNNKSLVNIGFSAPPRNFRRYELWASVSTDFGDNWSAFQQLTQHYTGEPEVALNTRKGVNSADLVELSDGRILVAYSEGSEKKFIDDGTDPSFTPAASVTFMHYLVTKGILLFGTNGDGLYAVNLSTGATKKFAVDTSPFIWGNNIVCAATDESETILAIGTETSLEIIDCSDALASNWVSLYSLRGTTIPALRQVSIANVYFTSADTLYAFYGGTGSGTANVIGAVFDLTLSNVDSGFMTDITVTSGDTRVPQRGSIHLWNDFLVMRGYNNTILGIPTNVALTGGYLVNTDTVIAPSYGVMGHDPYNDEFLWVGTDRVSVIRIKPTLTGDTISFAANGEYVAGSTSLTGLSEPIEIPGVGILGANRSGAGVNWAMWRYIDSTFTGALVKSLENYKGSMLGVGYPPVGHVTSDGKWIIWYDPNGQVYDIFDLQQTGILYYSIFDYASHQFDVSSTPVWTQLANPNRVGTDIKYLLEPRLAVDDDDGVYVAGYYFRITAGKVARIFTKIEPDAYRLTVRATIVDRNSSDLTIRGRVRKTITETIGVLTHINFAQCVKIKANVVPFTNQSMTSRGCILGRRRATATGTFLVQLQERRVAQMSFYGGSGNVKSRTFGVRASISPVYSTRGTMNFFVSAPAVGNGIITVTPNSSNYANMRARARISHA